MISKTRLSAFAVVAVLAAQPLSAESVYACPDLSQARQVADCPSNAELEHIFSSSCGSKNTTDENPHAKGACRSFKLFKQKKNTALWESANGEYLGYVSCNTPAAEIKAGRLVSINLLQRGRMDKITCAYDSGAKLALRTRESCQVPGAQPKGEQLSLDCSADGGKCKAICK
jgi:hypothetical protein